MTDPTPAPTEITGELLHRMLVAALSNLRSHCEEINALNVYPVPDGDTGTNMVATLESAVEHVSVPDAEVSEVAGEVSIGSLMGARGNSGVILSQLLRGFASGVQDMDKCSPVEAAAAMNSGVKAAYSAVMRPVEGTILTVAREAGSAGEEDAARGGDLVSVARASLNAAREALERTPEMLDVLKEAGVVDAGGCGLVCILKGALIGLARGAGEPEREAVRKEVPGRESAEVALDNPYDVVLLLDAPNEPGAERGAALDEFGDSLIVINEGQLTKVHIHTADPLAVLKCCLQWGELVDAQVQNMKHQSLGQVADQQDENPVAIIPTAAGPGLRETFMRLGATRVVEGGPTMNPSTEDILQAVEEYVQCDRIFLLPNNPNVILTCEQVQKLSSGNVSVVATENIPQGLAALMAVSDKRDELSPEEVHSRMSKSVRRVKALEVTHAVDDRNYSGLSLSRGDIIGFADGELAVVGDSPVQVLLDLLDKCEDSRSHLTIFWGSMVSESAVQKLQRDVDGRYGDLQIEVLFGGQDHYHFIAALR